MASGGFFSLHRLGRFRFKKSAFPLPLLCPPSSDSYTVRNFRYTVRFAPGQPADNPRTFTGQFRGVLACFRAIPIRQVRQTGIASRRPSQEAEESLPLTPSEKFGGRAIKKMLCGVLRSYPAQCSREPLFGGLMVRFCRISPRLLEPLREDHSPAASFRPLNGSPYFPFSFRLSLEACIPWRPNAISSVLWWMNANKFAIRTPRYSRYRPYLVGL